ncbi:MAG TPA: DUF3857 domain-containing protein [Candidatus Polarisedimenticolia bacterium]|nr:DUF3857 domain-containing protein [Candidatus Polarisedimenticolia bacterium]
MTWHLPAPRSSRWIFATLSLALLIAVWGGGPIHAAKEKAAEGDWPPITDAERNLKRVEQDPEADAVVLDNERSGKIQKKGSDTVNVLTYHWRLKVLTDRGKRYGEVHIPAQKYSRVSNIQARTIKPDGSVLPVAQDQIFEKVTRQIGTFKWTEWVFNFPAVEPGAIIEYRYDRYDNNLLFIDPFYFEGEEFTVHSKFVQGLPGDMSYSVVRLNTGDVQPAVTDWHEGKIKGKLFTLELSNLQGYKDEVLMPPRRDVSPRLEMVLKGWAGYAWKALARQDRVFIDWPSVAKWARFYYFEAMQKGQGEYKTLVDSWAQGVADPQEKIKTVVRHVQQDFAYIPWDTVIGASRPLETLLKEHNADNEEKAVLLLAALKVIGVEGSIALVSGRNVGAFSPNYFSLSQFSHAVVAVPRPDGSTLWIDPTVTYAQVGFMPWKDSEAGGLLLKTDQGEQVTLPSKNEMSTTKYKVVLKPRADGKADLEVEAEYQGEDAITMREELAPAAETARIAWLQDWLRDERPGAALRSHTIENLTDVDKPLVIKMNIEASGLVTVAEDVLLVRGCALSCQESNPVSRGARHYPYYVNPGWNEEETLLIQPAEGMKATTMPPPIATRSEIGSLVFSCMSQSDGGARCTRQFVARRNRWPATVQDNLRKMYDKVVEADHATVAFQKGGEAAAGAP